MATNIDKALFQQPAGLEADAMDAEPIEIEIVDPEEVTIGMGGMELTISKDEFTGDDFDANLADEVADGVLATLSEQLSSDIDNDRNSRKDWEKAMSTV